MKVRLIPNNKVDCVPDFTRNPSQNRTHKVICKDKELTIKELVNLLDTVQISIKGNGNGSVLLMGCI